MVFEETDMKSLVLKQFSRMSAREVRLVTCLMVAALLAASLYTMAGATDQHLPSSQEAAITMRVSVGFDGNCLENRWIPLRVRLENNGPDISGHVSALLPTTLGRNSTYSLPVELPQTSRKEVFLYVFPELFLQNLTVRLHRGSEIFAEQELRVNCLTKNDHLIGVISGSPSAFNQLAELDPPQGTTHVAQTVIRDIPDRAAGLESLFAMVISDADTSELTNAQIAAIEGWVLRGGFLIVTGGPSWRETATGLEELLPVRPRESIQVEDMQALAEFAAVEAPQKAPSVVAVGDLTDGARVLAQQGDVPLLSARDLGFGRVIYFAADPSLAPLAGWFEITSVYQRALKTEPLPTWVGSISGWDYAAQAVSIFQALELPSTGLIVGFILVYIVAVGPVNYFLLTRRRNREIAWVTIPLLVLAFSALAFVLGGNMRGNRPILNQVTVVQAWPESQSAHVTGLVGLFSPSRATYDLAVREDYLAHPITANTLAGRRGGWTIHQEPDGSALLPDLSLDVAGLSAFTVSGWCESAECNISTIEHDLVFRVDQAGPAFEGTVENAGGPLLQDAVLFMPGAVQSLGDFAPGERRTIRVNIPTTPPNPPGTFMPLPPGATAYYPWSPGFDTPGLNALVDPDPAQQDPETLQRFNLLASLILQETPSQETGGGVFLAGWTDSSPIEVEVAGGRAEIENLTLLIYRLRPEMSIEGETIVITPSLFSWQVQGHTGAWSYPYGRGIEPRSSMTVVYQPVTTIDFEEVQELVLHLESYGSTRPVELDVSIWDFQAEEWVLLPIVAWGDNDIFDPSRYVSPTGEIRLEISNPSEFSVVSLESMDFTLTVER